MPNIMNILAGLLSFIISSVMAYALWTPVMNFLDFFPTPLYVLCAVMWVALLAMGIVFFPASMLLTEDRG